MNGEREDAWLLALASAASDASGVDWDEAERRAADLGQRQLIRQLRGIAAIADAHRVDQERPDGAPVPSPAVTHWRHLVLFESAGAGAFGTVYRGWDPVLEREVALKVLAPARLNTPAPLDEARHLARIRHPHVVCIHGADTDGERAGIWMEYIEGLTLAQIVRERGPMSAREVIGIGLDLCSALSAIHAAGLVHRDIKAQNVMREVGGRIVLMDFSGAHRLMSADGDEVFSGTPLYMAPELFVGAPAGVASDVYSLGVLLFFLLSARVPVEGKTIQDVRLAHANGDRKRLLDVRADIPDGLVHVIERATASDPAQRFRSPGELQHALAGASGAQLAIAGASRERPRSSSRRLRLGVLAAALLMIAGAIAAFTRVPPRPSGWPGIARFTIGPPYRSGSWPRISPDGKLVVFGAIVEGRNRFWIHPLDKLSGQAVMETTATETPFWSPDSTVLAYFEDEKLKRIAIGGGEPKILADAPSPRGGDWHGNTILYSRQGGIYQLDVATGATGPATSLDAALGDHQHTWPEFLPDGRRFLYIVRSSSPERTGLYVGSLDGTPAKRLLPAHSRSTYAAGHILYVRDRSLVAHPFDADTLSLRDDPVTIARQITQHPASDAAFDVSPSGVLIYSPDYGSRPSTRLMLYDRRGREVAPVTPVGSFARPRFSPDGERIVAESFETAENNSELWVYGITPKSATRLTRHPAPDVAPAWSPDGQRVVFSSQRSAVHEVFVKPVDGVEGERVLVSAPGDALVEHWSPDGRYVSAAVLRSGLWVLPAGGGSEKAQQIRADERATCWQSEFSPDGKWLAYGSDESGQSEVYVEPFPATGARWHVSAHGGAEPHWGATSNELFYLDSESFLTSVVRQGAPGWRAGVSQRLLKLQVPDLAGKNDYAISADGRYLAVNVFIADPVVPPIEVVVNWQGLLGR